MHTQNIGYRTSTPYSIDTNIGGSTSAFLASISTAGNVSVTLVNGGTMVLTLPVGTHVLPLQVLKYNTTGTTATGTYHGLS